MTDDAIQGMLFAGLGTEPAVDDEVANDELRLCSLNINSANPVRAQHILEWLATTGSNALVLTEVKPGAGGDLIRTSLDAQGYRVHAARDWRAYQFHTLVATKGFAANPVTPAFSDPRVIAIDLATEPAPVRLVGIYGPTNGMTADSSQRRSLFQNKLLHYLRTIHKSRLCVAGDLNVVEPDHQPALPAFEEHDYAFYRGLLSLGMRDAYRTTHPDGTDHSWFSPRFGSQRLDHALVGATAALRACAYDHTPRLQHLTDHSAITAVIDLNRAPAT
jgi:exonuclease III